MHRVPVPAPRLFRAVFFAASALAAGCHADSGPTTPEVVVVRDAGPTAMDVSVSFEIEANEPSPTEDVPPQSAIFLVLFGSDGETVRTRVDEYPGTCGAEEVAAEGDVATVRCWWAGAGLTVHAIRTPDGLSVRRLPIYEESAEDMSESVETYLYSLSAGASVHPPVP